MVRLHGYENSIQTCYSGSPFRKVRPTTPCSNPLAFYRNLTTMHGRLAMPPDSRQVDVQQERGERNPAPTLGPALQELATAAGAGDAELIEPKLLPDEQELRRIIDLIPQTIVVL